MISNTGPSRSTDPENVDAALTVSVLVVVAAPTSRLPSISTEFLNELYLIPGSTLSISPSVLVEFSTNGKKKN